VEPVEHGDAITGGTMIMLTRGRLQVKLMWKVVNVNCLAMLNILAYVVHLLLIRRVIMNIDAKHLHGVTQHCTR
jgi:hypothetical protein